MVSKPVVIGKIMGLMEEKRVTKDWLLDQAKIHHIKTAPTLNSYEILNKFPVKFLDTLLKSLRGDDYALGDINEFTKTYHWFFTDIVASANPKSVTKEQLQKIFVLNDLIKQSSVFQTNKDHAALVPTGDGIAIGFPDSAEHPLQLAIDLHKRIAQYNKNRKGNDKLTIRIGIDTGPVYIIESLTDEDNYWGPGIIMARRIMDTADQMHIFTSKSFADDIRKLSREYKEIFHDINEYSIKHGETIHIFNVYGRGFGNKSTPRKTKIVRKQETEKDLLGVNTFTFKEIELELKVTNPKTMLTHHTWTWNLVNISKKPADQIFYHLDGDTPRDFSKLNVHVTDEKGDELDVLSVSENKPLRKEFLVKLAKPVRPRHQRTIMLEYDWEEPDRVFLYKLATDCKKFSYRFVIPKNIQIKNRILKVDPDLGYKWHASSPAKLSYDKKNTIIQWSAANLKAHDTYKFEW